MLVHDLLRKAICEETKSWVGEKNDPITLALVYETVAMSFSDLAFSYGQFMEAIYCLADSGEIVFDEEEYQLSLGHDEPRKRAECASVMAN